MKGQPLHDVVWRIPKRKKPIAYSPKSISDFVVDLAEGGGTIKEIYQQSLNSYCYDAQDILKQYIDLGYGDIRASSFFRRNQFYFKGKDFYQRRIAND